MATSRLLERARPTMPVSCLFQTKKILSSMRSMWSMWRQWCTNGLGKLKMIWKEEIRGTSELHSRTFFSWLLFRLSWKLQRLQPGRHTRICTVIGTIILKTQSGKASKQPRWRHGSLMEEQVGFGSSWLKVCLSKISLLKIPKTLKNGRIGLARSKW